MVSIKNLNFFKSISAQNVYISLLFKILTSLMFLVMVPFSIRTMGTEAYGVAAFFLTMHGSVSLLDSGFTYALGLQYTRRLVQNPDSAKQVFFSAIPVYLGLAFLALLGFIIFREKLSVLAFGTADYSGEMLVFGFVVGLTALDSMLGTVLQAHEKINLIATGRFLLDLVKVAGVGLMAVLNLGPTSIVWFILLSSIVKIVYDFFYFRKFIPEVRIHLDFSEVKQMLKFALPSVAIAVCSLVMSMLDKFLVSGTISSSAFTSYSFAFDLTSKAYFLMYAITSVVYPKLIKSHSTGQNPANFIKIQLLSLLIIAVIYYLPLAVFSGPITALLLGNELIEPTATLIKLCSVSALLYLSFTIVETYLNTTGAVLKTLTVYIVGISSLIILMKHFVPKFQLYGVAISVALMFTVMIVVGLMLILFRRRPSL